MSKTYIYCLIVIFTYLLIINPLNKKSEKESKIKEKLENDGIVKSFTKIPSHTL